MRRAGLVAIWLVITPLDTLAWAWRKVRGC